MIKNLRQKIGEKCERNGGECEITFEDQVEDSSESGDSSNDQSDAEMDIE
jgi:hypothetical protein